MYLCLREGWLFRTSTVPATCNRSGFWRRVELTFKLEEDKWVIGNAKSRREEMEVICAGKCISIYHSIVHKLDFGLEWWGGASCTTLVSVAGGGTTAAPIVFATGCGTGGVAGVVDAGAFRVDRSNSSFSGLAVSDFRCWSQRLAVFGGTNLYPPSAFPTVALFAWISAVTLLEGLPSLMLP